MCGLKMDMEARVDKRKEINLGTKTEQLTDWEERSIMKWGKTAQKGDQKTEVRISH